MCRISFELLYMIFLYCLFTSACDGCVFFNAAYRVLCNSTARMLVETEPLNSLYLLIFLNKVNTNESKQKKSADSQYLN